MPPKLPSTPSTTHRPKPPGISPVVVAAIILGLSPDSFLKYHETETGGIIVITGYGQKFTFTAEQIGMPEVTRAVLKASGVIVFGQLPPEPAPRLHSSEP